MDLSIKQLEFIEVQTKDIIYYYNKTKVQPVSYFYLGLLERLHSGAIGLKHILNVIKQVPELEFTAGVTIRTLLLDFLIGLTGSDIYSQAILADKELEQADADLLAYCMRMLADGVQNTAYYFTVSHGKGQIDDAKLDQVLTHLSNNYSPFIEEYQNDKKAPKSKYPKGLSGTDLFRHISDNPRVKELAKYYDTYALFSKYEHFSAMSYEVMRRDISTQLPTLRNAVEVLVLHGYICCEILNVYLKDNYMLDKLKQVDQYIKQEIFGMQGV